ncbi:helix-turn-helix domain-containing protein [Bacillus cereus group sp. MYBK234-1]|uniref:helix-turn-helix domain-containing protein n=1 Tax=unclassified Bacillus cereus group TaxID=2750818 RepID=UPI003F79E0A6
MIGIGNKIKNLRKNRGWTQQNLGEKVGASSRVIGYYESEERFPPHDMITKLADTLQVTTDFLLGRSEEADLDVSTYSKFKEIMERLDKLPDDQQEIVLQQMLAITKTLEEHHNKTKK